MFWYFMAYKSYISRLKVDRWLVLGHHYNVYLNCVCFYIVFNLYIQIDLYIYIYVCMHIHGLSDITAYYSLGMSTDFARNAFKYDVWAVGVHLGQTLKKTHPNRDSPVENG